MNDFEREADIAARAAQVAAAIVASYAPDALQVRNKSVDDKGVGDPVTAADLAADRAIVDALQAAFPQDAIVSEERPSIGAAERVWFVDPIDGTRELIEGTGDECTMIGLAVAGVPRLGVLSQRGQVYVGITGVGAWRDWFGARAPLRVSAEPRCRTLLSSRAHRHALMPAIVRALGGEERRAGSVGTKCLLIASGVADAYVEPFGQTHPWDTCAPQAVLEAAGGRLTDLHGRALRHDDRAPHTAGLLASNGACHAFAVEALARVLAAPGA
jgi:3'(2'), 5'-bisphosphate nucleotidase